MRTPSDRQPPQVATGAALQRGGVGAWRLGAALAGALVLAMCVAACSGPFRARLEASGPALTPAQADVLAQRTDISALAGVKASSADTLRQAVLAQLRRQGALGGRAADLLTAGFPAKTLAVPVLVRACKVGGRDAIVVVEAFGQASEDLVHRRLWVFDASSGGILWASSFN